MAFAARAPGKLVILGEYAVLSGAPALVMAVNRYARARIEPSSGRSIRLELRLGRTERLEALPGEPTGNALVDGVCEDALAGGGVPAFCGSIDTSAFFDGDLKLGLGSSAAALCAFAGAWTAYRGACGRPAPAPGLERLMALHRRIQGGAGSGVDVAASFTGGVIRFTLDPAGTARIGSVPLPNSVGFAGIFAGKSASTPDFVARYHAWTRADPGEAGPIRQTLWRTAEAGCEAARGGDARGLLAAVADYGAGLEGLGRAMGAEVVTDEHRRIGREARRCNVVYKVSGAGGGDLGLALSLDPAALGRFNARVAALGFRVVELTVDRRGLVVEELSE